MGLSDVVVSQACAGDPSAVESLYRELAPRVQRYFWGRGSEDPDGLTNEVFLALLPRLETLEGGAAGLTKLAFSIAHARYVDEVRRRSRRPMQVPYEPQEDHRSSPGAETESIESLGGSGVLQMLSGLEDTQREVIALRVLADMSLKDTAAVVGRSVGAVKQLQRRGLLALRATLEEGGERDA